MNWNRAGEAREREVADSPRVFKKTITRPGIWLLLVLFLAITFLQYARLLGHPAFLTDLTTNLGLTRYTVERILYLLPIIWASLSFGWKGGVTASLLAVAGMLPRDLITSPMPEDALVETTAVFIVGSLASYSIDSLRKERKRRAQMEIATEQLKVSEQRYRELFENAHDAIWVNNMQGTILMANKACEKLIGYTRDELIGVNINKFFPDEYLDTAEEVTKKLVNGEALRGPYEQRLIRKDGVIQILRVATSLVVTEGDNRGLQHIAQDITEERKTQENLHYLLQQITRAQEEERKRIARELHDDTIQALVVHSQQIYDLSTEKELPEDCTNRLEELRQQAIVIMQGLRRLSHDLRPSALERLGLMPTLRRLAADVKEYSGVETEVRVLGLERRLPAEVELVLFRIVQEGLRNVWKHAQATSAEIIIEFSEKNIKVTVSDNGKGFDTRQTVSELPRYGKLGLAGMQERARILGGTLIVKSEPGKGTILMAELPV